MSRERMTWGGRSARPVLPVEAAAKRGSAHPQTPDEGITHPAGYKDPTQPAAYENGNTSQWAEDPMGPPYRTSLQPANPMDDGGYRHPAAQPGAPAKNARALRAAVELKATKCIRIASALLGEEISAAAEGGDLVASDMVEAQALAFMDLPDEHVASTLRRIEAATEDADTLLRKMIAEEKGEEDEGEEEEKKKEAGTKLADEVSRKLAEVTNALTRLQAQVAGLSAPKVAEEASMTDEEAMLAEMLMEESEAVAEEIPMADEEAMLAEMLVEESEPPAAPEAPAQAGKSLADLMDPYENDFDIDMDVVEDPMGLFDTPDYDNGEMLASLFASDHGARQAEEEEEEKEEEPKKEASRRVASITDKLRPQARKAGVGAKTVGNVRVASGGGDVSDLAKLWGSAPDVSRIFNS